MGYTPRYQLQKRYTKGERFNQIMEYIFYCHQRGWRPSSHEIARELSLKPSHHVRGLIAELATCGMISGTSEKLPNGWVAHRWRLEIQAINDNHPEWKAYLTEKFRVWPIELL